MDDRSFAEINLHRRSSVIHTQIKSEPLQVDTNSQTGLDPSHSLGLGLSSQNRS